MTIRKKNRKMRWKKNGFTLIETLISITILMISVAAPLSIAWQGVLTTALSKQQIVAYYLAQDVYEFVKNKIDSNKLATRSYSEGGILYGLSDCVTDTCRIDTLTGDVRKYNVGDYVGYNPSLNVYGYDGVGFNDTIYSREIKITKIKDTGSSIDEIAVTVTIKWNAAHTGTKQYVLTGHITNW